MLYYSMKKTNGMNMIFQWEGNMWFHVFIWWTYVDVEVNLFLYMNVGPWHVCLETSVMNFQGTEVTQRRTYK